jgi:Putative porin
MQDPKMNRVRQPLRLASILVLFFASVPLHAADAPSRVADATLEAVLQRLDALEAHNASLQRQVAALVAQNTMFREQQAPPVEAAASSSPAHDAASDEWASRIRFKGDFRFRRESTDNEADAVDRTREGIRARFGAQIGVNDSLEGEIALGTGGANPRGGSATLGGGSSRKDFDLDLAYISWHARDDLTLTFGKMRQPFFRPGFSAFIDNEIRPEGIALAYGGAHGVFGSAFRYWIEERPQAGDSMLTGAQIGWRVSAGPTRLVLGMGYYDYSAVRGQLSRFANGVMNEFGNSVTGSGTTARYISDYDVAQAFGELSFNPGKVPFSLFADYAYNSAADRARDRAHNFGVIIGKADAIGRWELGALTQRVEKDALFAQWLDSDFGAGFADHRGEAYRFGWMLLKNTLLNLTYYDTQYLIATGPLHYRHWQLDLNFTF